MTGYCYNCGGDGFSTEGGPCPACKDTGKELSLRFPKLVNSEGGKLTLELPHREVSAKELEALHDKALRMSLTVIPDLKGPLPTEPENVALRGVSASEGPTSEAELREIERRAYWSVAGEEMPEEPE